MAPQDATHRGDHLLGILVELTPGDPHNGPALRLQLLVTQPVGLEGRTAGVELVTVHLDGDPEPDPGDVEVETAHRHIGSPAGEAGGPQQPVQQPFALSPGFISGVGEQRPANSGPPGRGPRSWKAAAAAPLMTASSKCAQATRPVVASRPRRLPPHSSRGVHVQARRDPMRRRSPRAARARRNARPRRGRRGSAPTARAHREVWPGRLLLVSCPQAAPQQIEWQAGGPSPRPSDRLRTWPPARGKSRATLPHQGNQVPGKDHPGLENGGEGADPAPHRHALTIRSCPPVTSPRRRRSPRWTP